MRIGTPVTLRTLITGVFKRFKSPTKGQPCKPNFQSVFPIPKSRACAKLPTATLKPVGRISTNVDPIWKQLLDALAVAQQRRREFLGTQLKLCWTALSFRKIQLKAVMIASLPCVRC